MYIGFWPFVVWLCNDCSLWSSCEMITNVDILRYRFVCTVLYCLVCSLNIDKFSSIVCRSIFWHISSANGLWHWLPHTLNWKKNKIIITKKVKKFFSWNYYYYLYGQIEVFHERQWWHNRCSSMPHSTLYEKEIDIIQFDEIFFSIVILISTILKIIFPWNWFF